MEGLFIYRKIIAPIFFAGLLSISAFADGKITRKGKLWRKAASSLARDCSDPSSYCGVELLRLISAVNYANINIGGGWMGTEGLGEGFTNGALSFARFDLLSGDLPIGDFNIGRFEAIFLPDSKGTRLRFSLAGSETFFLCKDHSGQTHLPGIGHLRNFCKPESNLGIGGQIVNIEWDQDTGRFGGKWAQFNFVLNLFGAPQSMEYLRSHLNAIVGADFETATPSQEPTEYFSRGLLGLSGLIRSGDGHWEGSAKLGFRPVIIGTVESLKDFGLTGEAALFYRIQSSVSRVITAGLQFKGDYWTNPTTSFGAISNDRDTSGVYMGLMLGVSHEYGDF